MSLGFYDAVVQVMQNTHAHCSNSACKVYFGGLKSGTRTPKLIWWSAQQCTLFPAASAFEGSCHIQLSKCMRQQSLLVMRALGRDWFLTSSPEIFPTSHEAEMCGDAPNCSSAGMAHDAVEGSFKGAVQTQWADPSQVVVN